MNNIGIKGMRKEIQMKQKKMGETKDRITMNNTIGSENIKF
jgi:hypothetical protein